MRPDQPNPQTPDPFRRKIRASEYARLYDMSIQGVHHQIRQNRIAAEQPAGSGTTWYIWLEVDLASERDAEERLILAEMERGAA